MARSRRPEIVADAAHAIFVKPSRECTGNFFLVEDVLAAGAFVALAAYVLLDRRVKYE